MVLMDMDEGRSRLERFDRATENDMTMVGMGETGKREPRRGVAAPIDLVFLARQTFGNRAVELEVLRLFRDQAPRLAEAARGEMGEARSRHAHRLVGAARAIGAGAVAEAARAIEIAPDTAPLSALDAAVDDTLAFIAGLDDAVLAKAG